MNAPCLTFHLNMHLSLLKLLREDLTCFTIECVPRRPLLLCMTRERRIARSSAVVTPTAFLGAAGE